MSDPISLRPIGFVRTPFRESSGTPIQSVYARDVEGTIEIFPEFVDGLRDLDGFEFIWLICYFDRAVPPRMLVTPYRDDHIRGVFSTRAPSRPNAIGLSCVRLLSIDGCALRVAGVDMLDQTPVLDIKPYIAELDVAPSTRHGWFDQSKECRSADDRFEKRVTQMQGKKPTEQK